jgi:hypothetical protein
MSRDSVVRWIERSPYLHEARATLPDGQDVYLGYIAMTPGAAVWRGYVDHDFEPVGLGLPSVLRKAVEQRACEATRGSVVGDAGREAAHHAS